MVNNYYQLYIEDVLSLAQSMTIKFNDAACAINFLVIQKEGVGSVGDDPYTWKYYQNISGAYHFSDEAMYITSLDTLEQILFIKQNLDNHPATRKAYQFDTRQYRELLQRFPDQELLILGILYPCDISVAINAKDATILSYPPYLVEFNEYNLISKLQDLLYNYFFRWVNKQYTISDDLYVATYIAQLYLYLVPAIINLRLSACKTNEAHSFHVRQYLASREMLDIYLNAMTKSQALFFYINILYIERNAGKQDTLDFLVQNVMTVRGLPLYDFVMKHIVSNMLPNDFNGQTLNYYPDLTFRRKPINFPNIDPERTFSNLDQIIAKIDPIARDNPQYQQDTYTELKQSLEDSKSNVVLTKLLESSVTDYTDSVPYTLESILLNQWIDWSISGVYSAYVDLAFPKTKTSLVVSVKEALIIFVYALNKSIGVNLNSIPNIEAIRVLREPLYNLNGFIDYTQYKNEIKSITESKYLTNEAINELISTIPEIEVSQSIDSFYKQAYKVFESTRVQYGLISLEEHYLTRGFLKTAVSKLYANKKLKLIEPNQTYNSFFSSLSLNFSGYTPLDFNTLATSIFSQTTGILDNQSISLKQIQRAMVDILTQLSSYSIQIVSDINQTGIVLVSAASIRVGDVSGTESYQENIRGSNLIVLDINGMENSRDFFDYNVQYPSRVSFSMEKTNATVDLSVRVTENNTPELQDPTLVELPNITIIQGDDFYSDYALLTPEQKMDLVDAY